LVSKVILNSTSDQSSSIEDGAGAAMGYAAVGAVKLVP